MVLIPIPSESCPYCKKKEGSCRMIINEIQTLRAQSLKTDEMDYRSYLEGRNGPAFREAYVVKEFVCLNGKGVM